MAGRGSGKLCEIISATRTLGRKDIKELLNVNIPVSTRKRHKRYYPPVFPAEGLKREKNIFLALFLHRV